MKQRLLTLGLVLSMIGAVSAQDEIWREDFSDGLNGWTVNPIQCDLFQSGMFGTWTIASATIGGTAVDISPLTFEWSFMNSVVYTIDWSWDDTGEYGSVYANYSYQGDTLVSTIDASMVAADGLSLVEQGGGLPEWGTIIGNLPDAAMLPVRHVLIGAGNPIVTFDGTSMTHTSQDGSVVVTYERSDICGKLWHWSPNGNWSLGSGNNAGRVVSSETAANGTVAASSWIMQTLNGTGGAPPYPEFTSELTSPNIDISAADVAMALDFYQTTILLNDSDSAPGGFQTSVQFSNDDGATWTLPIDVNPDRDANTIFDDTRSIVIPDSVTRGQTTLRLRFTYGGDFYGWHMDDIVLRERQPYEMQANNNFFAIGTYVNTPYLEVEEMGWVADIQNNGGAPANNVTLNLTVTGPDGSDIFTEDLDYGTINPDSLAQNKLFTQTLTIPQVEASQGDYNGVYTLSHDNVGDEADDTNDSNTFSFTITDTLFAAETGRTRNLFVPNNPDIFIGNAFYVPNGEGMYARYISFQVEGVTDVLAAGGDGNITTHLYESDGDVTGPDGVPDGRISGDELTTVAFNLHTLTDADENTLVTIPVSFDTGSVPLRDNKHYLAVIQYNADNSNDDDLILISSSEQYGYGGLSYVRDSLFRAERYTDVVALTDMEPEFFSGGFAGRVVPMVRLSIGNNPDLMGEPFVSTDNILPTEYATTVFPNPADQYLNATLAFPEATNVDVMMFDVTGRIIFQRPLGEVQSATVNFDTVNLPNGNYFLRFDTPAGSRTQKVNVQH